MTKLFADKYKHPTTDTDQFVSIANAHIDQTYAHGKRVCEPFFHALAVFLSRINIEQKNGGPFGAVIVEFDGGIDAEGRGIGRPKIIGIGANHVVPNNDPSAHAEMEAYRDAAKRKGSSDLGGTALFTSCECCPMCLSVANGAGISKISYVNTRLEAEAIEFSDKLQYDLFKLQRNQQMTALNQLDMNRRNDIVTKLGSHGAMILDATGEVFAYGDADTRTDPTGIASINVVRNAVKKYAGNEAAANNPEPVFNLPDKFIMVSRDIPHPAGLITADWARLLRKRDNKHNDNPMYDSKNPDPARIIHVTNQYEQLAVSNQHGLPHIHQDAVTTYQQPVLPDEKRAVRTERFTRQVIPVAAQEVFNDWKRGIVTGAQVRY